MLVSYNWLNELVDLTDIPVNELADKMSRTGIEVEDVIVPAEGLKKIVVGDVKECVPHTDSDHLSVCQIDVGEDDLYQIVCGAPNIQAGKKVIVALPNSRIADNVKIKKGKMRGEVSLGMVCALQELGYADSVVPKAYSEGIYFLPDNAVPGEPVFRYLEMNDQIIELSVTPNRADALSMRGVAHEVAAIYNKSVHFPTKTVTEDDTESVESKIKVTVDNVKDTPTYTMRVIKDVKVSESPLWLQTRLMNEGIRPVNNVVDATNYTLLLFGQPQHAFDYDKLGTAEIDVRRASDNEELVTLDGVERALSSENLVITNGEKPIALAGIMGGESTEIDDATTTVALETALFEPTLIRRTARSFGLSSESSKRFERGINTATIMEASDFTASLIAELSGGKVLQGTVISTPYEAQSQTVTISLKKINDSLGTELTVADILTILAKLGFETTELDEQFTVVVPPRRWDITIEADLVEEVARIYGYDNLPSTLPSGSSLLGNLTHSQQLIRDVRRNLEGSGLDEAISYALTTPELAVRFVKEAKPVVELDWPMSQEHSILRQSLTSGLLVDTAYNLARKNKQIALYEIGKVFESRGKSILPIETKHVALAVAGEWQTNEWNTQTVSVDFFTLKGIVEDLLSILGMSRRVRFVATTKYKDLHPGRTAEIIVDNIVVGFIGQVHPTVAKEMDLIDTYVSELDLEVLCELSTKQITFKEVTKYPSIKRDMALLVDKSVTNQQIIDVIISKAGRFLKDIHLFDVYEGENLGSGKKSLAYSLIYQNEEATLVDEEVTSSVEKVTAALISELSIEVR
ncbi:phenylalanine--tRNA ligase subunit beta [Vagococcus vulneris]|uniref:Phenylalanine--tRNA ligase beta subunit n=1 Tax=Vagococcus vulneris TaxID=1977869 RepID=A0A429ZZ93_9ENTE|nr:phenylalanine--tRNA ligase subunit beta [Vagococcus vulneris]RST99300.1 phenylalanine--tRNA ligase subunit beta [Vagococcus vulneris]